MRTTSVMVAALLRAAAGQAPEQVHLAFAGAPDSSGEQIAVSWYTATEETTPTVCWAKAGGPSCSAGNATAITIQYLKNFGYHHHAIMNGLAAGENYDYVVGTAPNTASFTFKAPNSAPDQPFSVSVFGDMGWLGSKERPDLVPVGGLVKNWTAVGTRATVEKLKDNKMIDFVWHLGDIAYADDAFDTDPLKMEYENVYNGFVGWFQNVSSIMPYMVSVGNHESECHSPACILGGHGKALSNFSAYNARWRMPSASSGGVENMWYSFDFGPVHFVSLNSETDWPGAGEENTGDSGDKSLPAGHFGRDGEYLAWLEADLKAASANRATRPWIFAGGHRPLPEVSGNGVKELFAEYGVDMYFAGHTHSYARLYPVSNGTYNPQPSPNRFHAPNGTVEIIVGGAGCDEMLDELAATTPADVGGPPKTNVVTATAKVASGVLQVFNSSAVHWQLIYSHTGEILDDFWLTK